MNAVETQALAREHLDCALLDIRLSGEPGFALADALRERGVHFSFISGSARSVVLAAYQDAPCLPKVEDPKVLIRWVMGS